MRDDDSDWPDQTETSPFGLDRQSTSSSQLRCPRCGASQVSQRHIARRAGGTIGSIAGAVGGVCRGLAGYEAGLAIGALAFGPPGAMLGAVSGAVISALMGGTTGWTIGTKLGSAIDTSILDNYRCLSCQHSFSPTTQP